MPESTSPAPATQAEITAALLTLGRHIDLASLLLTCAALITLGVATLPLTIRLLLSGVVLLGLAEHFHALRVAFDAAIFSRWAARWQVADAAPQADLAAFDLALAAARLRATPAPLSPASPRPLAARIAGARRLLLRQGACCILQGVAWLTVIAQMAWLQ